MADTITPETTAPKKRPRKIVSFKPVMLGVPFGFLKEGPTFAINSIKVSKPVEKENQYAVTPGVEVFLEGLGLKFFNAISLLIDSSEGEKILTLTELFQAKQVGSFSENSIRFPIPSLGNLVNGKAKVYVILYSSSSKNLPPVILKKSLLYVSTKTSKEEQNTALEDFQKPETVKVTGSLIKALESEASSSLADKIQKFENAEIPVLLQDLSTKGFLVQNTIPEGDDIVPDSFIQVEEQKNIAVIYKDVSTDPQIEQVEQQIQVGVSSELAKMKAGGLNVSSKNIEGAKTIEAVTQSVTKDSWSKFVKQYPEKAVSYKQEKTEIFQALQNKDGVAGVVSDTLKKAESVNSESILENQKIEQQSSKSQRLSSIPISKLSEASSESGNAKFTKTETKETVQKNSLTSQNSQTQKSTTTATATETTTTTATGNVNGVVKKSQKIEGAQVVRGSGEIAVSGSTNIDPVSSSENLEPKFSTPNQQPSSEKSVVSSQAPLNTSLENSLTQTGSVSSAVSKGEVSGIKTVGTRANLTEEKQKPEQEPEGYILSGSQEIKIDSVVKEKNEKESANTKLKKSQNENLNIEKEALNEHLEAAKTKGDVKYKNLVKNFKGNDLEIKRVLKTGKTSLESQGLESGSNTKIEVSNTNPSVPSVSQVSIQTPSTSSGSGEGFPVQHDFKQENVQTEENTQPDVEEKNGLEKNENHQVPGSSESAVAPLENSQQKTPKEAPNPKAGGGKKPENSEATQKEQELKAGQEQAQENKQQALLNEAQKKEREQIEIKETIKKVNIALNSFLLGYASALWAAAIPTFGMSVAIGAFLGDLLLVVKNLVINRLIKPFLLNENLKNNRELIIKELKISGKVKLNIVGMNAVVIFIFFIFIFLVILVGCSYPTTKVDYKFSVLGMSGYSQICKDLESASASISSSSNSGNRGSTGENSGGPVTGKWSEQINTQSLKYNIDACILKTIVQKESGGKADAIGYDRDPNRGSFQLNNPPKYNLDWNYSHGIGLTQWTIFPQSGRNSWVDANTPSQLWKGKFYTVADFLNPEVSLDLTAGRFSDALQKGNSLKKVFGDYNGSGENGQYAQDSMKLYEICKNQ